MFWGGGFPIDQFRQTLAIAHQPISVVHFGVRPFIFVLGDQGLDFNGEGTPIPIDGIVGFAQSGFPLAGLKPGFRFVFFAN